jgi:hypothetical protein
MPVAFEVSETTPSAIGTIGSSTRQTTSATPPRDRRDRLSVP